MWAPRGLGLVVLRPGRRHDRLVLITPRGTRVPLPRAIQSASFDWSPDGKWLAFVRNDRLETLRPHGSDRRVVLELRFTHRGAGAACGPYWAPDSERLLLSCGEAEED